MSDSKMSIERALEIFAIAPPAIDTASAESPEAQLQTWKDGPLKKEWKKLAKQRHPDLNKGDPSAEVKFKELGEAYQVLSGLEIQRRPVPSADGRWTHEDAADAFSRFEEMLRQATARQAEARERQRKEAQARQAKAQERIKRRAQQVAEEIKARKTRAPSPPPSVPNPEDYDGPDHDEQLPPGARPPRHPRPPPAVRVQPLPAKKPGSKKGRKPSQPRVVVIVEQDGEPIDIKQGLDIADAVLGTAMDIGELFGVDAAFGFPKARKAVRQIRKLIK